jgi:hypothetical protein
VDRKNEKSIVTLREEELSAVAGGKADQAVEFRPSVAVADRGSQATSNTGDAATLAPVFNKQTTEIDAVIGNVLEKLGMKK